MLKALIQLFAEKFLQGKYPDIAYQCGPSTRSQSQTISGNGQKNIVAPFTGWAVLKIGSDGSPNNTWFRLENSTRGTAYLSNAICEYKAASIPIQKGDVLIVDFGSNNANQGILLLISLEATK